MSPLELSIDEKDLLKKYVRTTSLILIRYKCQAVLMKNKGMSLIDIADIVSQNDETVGRWIADWNQRRMASIFTGHEANENASTLTKAQRLVTSPLNIPTPLIDVEMTRK